MFDQLIYSKVCNKFFQNIVQNVVINSYYRIPIMRNLKAVFRNVIKTEVAELIQKKYKDHYCIFSRNGLGDIFFIASRIKEFKKIHGGKVVYFTEKSKLIPLLKSFPSLDDAVCIKDLACIQEIHCIPRTLEKGRFQQLFYPYRGEKETIAFLDNHANMLDIPLEAEFEKPVFKDEYYQKAQKEIERLNVNPEKTVVIIPEAVMFDYRVVLPKVWIKFAKKLKSMGYDVVFNSKNKAYKGFKRTFLPIMPFLAFMKQVKYIYSFRSGINDLMLGVDISNFTAIYPPNLEVVWCDPFAFYHYNYDHKRFFETEFDNAFNIYSLNSNFKRNDISEIMYDYNYDKFEKTMLNCLEKEFAEKLKL